MLRSVEQPSVTKLTLQDNHFNLWKSKPLHGQFSRGVEGDMDITLQWSRLTSGSLMPETEGFVSAAQDQAITTIAMRCNIFHLPVSLSCQLCGSHDETIDHLISGCEVITQRLYKHHHDEMARMLHWGLAKLEGLEIVPNWWNHKYV